MLKAHTKEKAASLTNGFGKTEYLCVKSINVFLIPYPLHKSISNGSHVCGRPGTLTCLRKSRVHFRVKAQVRHFWLGVCSIRK